MSATDLFQFHFKAPLNHEVRALLEKTTGMKIRFSDYGNTPGQGYIDDQKNVPIFFDEWGGEDRDPDLWLIEAWTHHPDDYDPEAVEEVAQRIRQVLPDIAEWWEEVPKEKLRR